MTRSEAELACLQGMFHRDARDARRRAGEASRDVRRRDTRPHRTCLSSRAEPDARDARPPIPSRAPPLDSAARDGASLPSSRARSRADARTATTNEPKYTEPNVRRRESARERTEETRARVCRGLRNLERFEVWKATEWVIGESRTADLILRDVETFVPQWSTRS